MFYNTVGQIFERNAKQSELDIELYSTTFGIFGGGLSAVLLPVLKYVTAVMYVVSRRLVYW